MLLSWNLQHTCIAVCGQRPLLECQKVPRAPPLHFTMLTNHFTLQTTTICGPLHLCGPLWVAVAGVWVWPVLARQPGGWRVWVRPSPEAPVPRAQQPLMACLCKHLHHPTPHCPSGSAAFFCIPQIMDWFDMRGIREAFTSVDYVGISAYVPQAGFRCCPGEDGASASGHAVLSTCCGVHACLHSLLGCAATCGQAI